MADRSSDLQLYLFSRVVLNADSRNEVELHLQPLDVLLALNDQIFRGAPACRYSCCSKQRGNPLLERGRALVSQLQILRQQLLEVLTNMHREWLVQRWHALQGKSIQSISHSAWLRISYSNS